jgi:hypothetical protein
MKRSLAVSERQEWDELSRKVAHNLDAAKCFVELAKTDAGLRAERPTAWINANLCVMRAQRRRNLAAASWERVAHGVQLLLVLPLRAAWTWLTQVSGLAGDPYRPAAVAKVRTPTVRGLSKAELRTAMVAIAQDAELSEAMLQMVSQSVNSKFKSGQPLIPATAAEPESRSKAA